jgi:hypothetical protein
MSIKAGLTFPGEKEEKDAWPESGDLSNRRRFFLSQDVTHVHPAIVEALGSMIEDVVLMTPLLRADAAQRIQKHFRSKVARGALWEALNQRWGRACIFDDFLLVFCWIFVNVVLFFLGFGLVDLSSPFCWLSVDC